MARAMGANATLLGLFESTYGTAPTSSAWNSLPFARFNFGGEQGWQADQLLGSGRDATDPIRDVLTVDGDVEVPLDLRNIGEWLKLLMGAPTTSGSGTLTHVFASGAASLPSMTLELGMPSVPNFFRYSGVMANTLAVSLTRSGASRAVIGLIGQSETDATTTLDSTPVVATEEKFTNFQGSLTSTAADGMLGNVEQVDFTFSNNLDRVEVIRGDEMIGGIDPGQATLSGSITTRFASTDLFDLAVAGTPIDLDVNYIITSQKKIFFEMPQLYLGKPKMVVPGPTGIRATFDFMASKSGSTAMLTARLYNDVAGY